jgi:4,5-dihydroxyphthalate decarboxylase
MANLKITLACWDYDRTRALFDGRVKPEGIELDLWSTYNVGEIMERMIRHRQFDVSELGITYYLRTLELPDPPFIAIPVFPNRFFRHSAVFVNTTKGIRSPGDLAGRRVGELQRYGHDAGIWAKGALGDDFGLKTNAMTHYVGGIARTDAGPDWAPFDPPKDVAIHRLSPEQGLDDMLQKGEIDALFSAHIPPSARRSPQLVQRLFPDYETVERDYFGRTGIFPIMHTVVIRREIYEKNRWIARAMMTAFEQAKAIALKAYNASDIFFNAPSMIPWFVALRERNRALLGDDYWPYGLEPNRKTLETCLRYHREQGLLKRSYSLEELFAPETLN